MTKPGLTAIAVVLDKSGSMGAIQHDTIEGFNRFLRDQQAQPGEALFSLTLFDTTVTHLHVAKPIAQIEALTGFNYVPYGGTALYDAVGSAIDKLGKELADLPETERPSKVIFVIQTDGEENSSREFSADDVKKRIEHQRDQYGWEFLFLGAGQDAWVGAGKMGIQRLQTLSYDTKQQGQALNIASSYTRSLRSTGHAALDSQDIRTAVKP